MAGTVKSGAIAKAQENKVTAQSAGKKTLQNLITQMKPQIANALPSVLTPERFTRMALTALSNNPKLQECTPASFLGAMMQAAQLGVEPNTPLQQAYLIPYKNKGQMEVQFQLGYRGLIDLAYRSGEITSISAHEVCENDEFEYELGLDEKMRHKPALKDRGEVILYYAVFRTKSGGSGFAVMSVEDVKKHMQKFSQAARGGFSPWQTNFDEMAKKGLSIDTPIPTEAGWTTMGEIQTGETVFDMYGNKTKVIATSEIKNIDCFKLTFSGGEELICDDEHRWVAFIGGSNARRDLEKDGWCTCTVNELYEARKEGKKILVPVTPELQCDAENLLIDPWMLGYWIGNGSSRHANVCCGLDDQEYIVQRITAAGYEVGSIRKDKRSNAVTIGVKGLWTKLKDLELLENKHIPEIYLRASIDQRVQLLQGLVDSDGCIASDSRARASYATIKEHIANAVHELLVSLGESPNKSCYLAKGFGTVTETYTISWQPSFCPAGMSRKAQNYRERKICKYRSIKAIEKIESVPTRCIAVEAESKTYLAGLTMIPTHNTVIKKVLKYAPIKTEFVRAAATDGTIKTTIAENMTDEPDETIVTVEAEPVAEAQQETPKEEPVVDPETGEILGQQEMLI